MATQPEIPPPDRIDPQSPPETPPDSPPSEDPFRQPPEIVPDQPDYDKPDRGPIKTRSEEHTSELQSLMRISYAVFCLKKKKQTILNQTHIQPQPRTQTQDIHISNRTQ